MNIIVIFKIKKQNLIFFFTLLYSFVNHTTFLEYNYRVM